MYTRRSRRPLPQLPPGMAGPWRGMRDTGDPATGAPDLAYLLQNLYPLDPGGAGSVVGRPGFEATGGTSSTVPLLGSSSASTHIAQGIAQWAKTGGTEYTVCWVDGKMYTYNWGTALWTEVSLAAFPISTTARVYWTVLADKLIFHDGIAKPRSWDGTTLAELTNCPVLFGNIVVYYAKLFGIKAAERDTTVWSEENDPTTGYEAGGFNNAWSLKQTSQEPLYALAATNEAFFFFRAKAIGFIQGAVSDNFVSAGTVDSGGQAVGTISPGSIVLATDDDTGGQSIFFIDIGGKARRLVGTQLQGDIWRDAAETSRRVNKDYLDRIYAVVQPELNLVLFSVPLDAAIWPNALLAFDAGSGQFSGIWNGFLPQAMGIVQDALGRERVMYIEYGMGRPCVQGTPDGDLWNDVSPSGGEVAIQHTLEPSPITWDSDIEKDFHRADILFRLESTVSGVLVDYVTSRYSRSTALELATMTADFGAWTADDEEAEAEGFPCLQLNGAAVPDQYARLPVPTPGAFGQACTIQALVRATSTPANSMWAFRGGDNADPLLAFPSHGTQWGSAGQVKGHNWRPASGVSQQFGDNVSDGFATGAWRRLSLVCSYGPGPNEGTNTVYLDSTEIVTLSGPSEKAFNGLTHMFAGKRLGSYGGGVDGDAGEDWTGYIADFRIWNRALSLAEIASHAFRRLSGDEFGLAGYWRMDEGTGTTLADSAGDAGAGLAVNAAWASLVDLPLTDTTPDNLVGRQVIERHAAAGLQGYGRWIRPRIRHAVLDEQFGVEAIKIAASAYGAHPRAL
jgi:hypothetical protein